MGRRAGWVRIPNAANGIEALGLYTGDSTARTPYVFGLGVTDSGRLSTATRAGAVVEFPDAYGFGEAWELRFRTADTSNGQFQGIFLQVRSDVANTSTIRGMEIEARQGAAVALGGLEGMHVNANVASSSTGNITTVKGISANVSLDDTYTGTITNLYGLHVKIQSEDGATITNGYGIRIENEPVTGAERLTAAIQITSNATTVGRFRYGIDSTGTEFTNGSGNEVVLWAFLDSAGVANYLVHDTDAATVLAVTTTDPTT